MKTESHIESLFFRLLKCAFAFALIFIVLVKPFRSSILELKEETIELTSETSEEEITEDITEEAIQHCQSSFASLPAHSYIERKQMAFRLTKDLGNFRQDIDLPPPEL